METGVAHTGGDARVDVDEDGYDDTVDCDDYDPSINPGAKEDWDLIDNDCDGRVDANGVYAGTASLSLRVVYEGTLRRWSVPCSGELVRETARVDVTMTCAIVEADDPLAITVLGEQIIIREVDNFVEQDTFGGAFDISSDTDWNTDASGSLIWVSLQKARGRSLHRPRISNWTERGRLSAGMSRQH